MGGEGSAEDTAENDDAYKRGLLVGVTILSITTAFGLIAATFFGCKLQEERGKKGTA